jgi:hypothetical protein
MSNACSITFIRHNVKPLKRRDGTDMGVATVKEFDAKMMTEQVRSLVRDVRRILTFHDDDTCADDGKWILVCWAMMILLQVP